MSAISQYVQQIALLAYFNVMRLIAGMQVGATDIQGRLYLTLRQMADLLGVTDQVVRYHLNKLYMELSTTELGVIPSPPAIYQCPVSYPSGAKQTKFYDLEILLLVAERMENNPRKEAILAEGRAIVAAYHNAGFVVNQQALQTDPRVLPNLVATSTAHNFSPSRFEYASVHKQALFCFHQCTDIFWGDGTVNQRKLRYFMRRFHNTMYMAATGMSARQIKDTRSNPTIVEFGLEHWRGKEYPYYTDTGVTANFMSDTELLFASGNGRKSMGEVLEYKNMYGVLPVKLALKLITRGAWTHKVPHYGMDINRWPETYPDLNTPDGPSQYLINRSIYRQDMARLRHMSIAERNATRQLENQLIKEALSGLDENGNVLPGTEAEQWYLDDDSEEDIHVNAQPNSGFNL